MITAILTVFEVKKWDPSLSLGILKCNSYNISII